MKTPVVSVVMPVYGAEEFVRAAVESVLAQTFTDFEFLVVDDGSTDRSIELVRTYDDSRIRIIEQANRGLPGARNTGIRNASGDLIALIDADDVWDPTKLEQHVEHLARRPGVDVSYSASRLIDEMGEPLGAVQMPKLVDISVRDVICRNPIGNGSAPVIRTSVFEAIGVVDDRHGEAELHYFDEDFRYAEDVECWTRIACTTGAVFEGIGALLTDYRVVSGSLSAGTEDHYRYWLKHYEKVQSYAPEVASQHGEAARGYQIRFYARRDLQAGSPRTALRWMGQALRAHPKMVIEEPAKTAITGAAILVAQILPAHTVLALTERVLRSRSKLTTAEDTGATAPPNHHDQLGPTTSFKDAA